MAARPIDVARDHSLRRLVRREPRLDVSDQRRFVHLVPGVRFHERGDRLAPLVVGHADHGGVGDRRVQLQRFLDLFWIDLLAAGVDALTAPAEQGDRAVGLDRGVVAGNRVPLAVDEGRTSGPTWPRPCSTRSGCGRAAPLGRVRPTLASRLARRRWTTRVVGAELELGGLAARFGRGRLVAIPIASLEPNESTMITPRVVAQAGPPWTPSTTSRLTTR